jgi:hypothetical protein
MSRQTIATLREEIASLESQLDEQGKPEREMTAADKLRAEIDSLEERIACLGMGEPADTDYGDDTPPTVEVGCGEPGMAYAEDDEMGDEPGMDDIDAAVDEMEMEVPIEEDVELDDDIEEVGMLVGSEVEPGVEDEITQDYLSEVQEEEHGEELTTDDSMNDAATASDDDEVVRFKRASARLDRVAQYLEKHGEMRLALRIDQIADAIDEAIKQEGE